MRIDKQPEIPRHRLRAHRSARFRGVGFVPLFLGTLALLGLGCNTKNEQPTVSKNDTHASASPTITTATAEMTDATQARSPSGSPSEKIIFTAPPGWTYLYYSDTSFQRWTFGVPRLRIPEVAFLTVYSEHHSLPYRNSAYEVLVSKYGEPKPHSYAGRTYYQLPSESIWDGGSLIIFSVDSHDAELETTGPEYFDDILGLLASVHVEAPR